MRITLALTHLTLGSILLVGPALLDSSVARADETSPPEYSAHVAPILKKYCAGCHNDGDREGDFSLESYESLRKGTPKGPAVLPGDAGASRLLRLVTGAAKPVMPPEDEPRPTEEEVSVLKAWIEAGAKGPQGAAPDRLSLIVPRIAGQVAQLPITSIAASPDGKWLAVARFSSVSLNPVSDGGAVGQPAKVWDDFPGKVTSLHFSADGTQLVIASGVAGLGGVATIRRVSDDAVVGRFEGHRDILYDAELSPDGKLLATCGYDKSILLWDVASGQLVRTLSGHNGAVYDVAFSPDSRFLVSASADDTCKVWRVADGVRMDTLGQPLKEVYCCQFSPDGRFIVAGGADNNLRVWRFTSTDKPRINPMVQARFAHEGPIVRLAITPDGKRLVTLAEDRTIKAWDTADYAELKLWENQPDVASGLALAGDAKAFYVGRMDGSLERYGLADLPAGSRATDSDSSSTVAATAMGDMGQMQSATEREPNNGPADANAVALPARVQGTIQGRVDGQADADLYRFEARRGEQWVVEVDAARSKSPLDSFIEVLDADGNRIQRLLLQAVRDSYFTFRGKDDDSVDDFRVFNWQEMRIDEYLYANGEVVKLWLYPRGPDSGFMTYPGQGKRWGYFDTTPLAHALGEPCYVVQAHPPGTPLIPNGLPEFQLYYENDDESRRGLGGDSRLFFTAPADGQYLVRIKDVRGYEGEAFKYQLTIRPRRPDFQVTLEGANLAVEPGGAREFKVKAQRIDNFEGPIRVDIGNLPPGFSASTPLVIQEGQIEAMGVVTAAADAVAPSAEQAKASQVTATARIWESDVTHPVNNLGELKLAAEPKLRVVVLPAEGGAVPTNARADGPLEFEMEPGQTIMLKVRVQRDGFDGAVPFGKEGAGRNLPFGVYIDDVGLNGLLLLDKQVERPFYITADSAVPAQERLFHLNTSAAGGQASQPVLLRIRGVAGDSSGDPPATAD